MDVSETSYVEKTLENVFDRRSSLDGGKDTDQTICARY